MERKKLLIAGDSFAADWTQKYPKQCGWPNMLSQYHVVTNVAQAGCSEYRIYKQLNNAELDIYDAVIISHTSPFRIYTDYNPVRTSDLLHNHCDLLYLDACNLACEYPEYASVQIYFEKFFNLEYAEFCYKCIRHEIQKLVRNKFCIEITHVPIPGDVDIDFSDVWLRNSGFINHYTTQGNKIIFDTLQSKL